VFLPRCHQGDEPFSPEITKFILLSGNLFKLIELIEQFFEGMARKNLKQLPLFLKKEWNKACI
jgi:hypothetical protein